jgi:hypothetical protein
MASFERAFRAWREAPFPEGSENDLVDELHAELAQLDAFVADAVIPASEGLPIGTSVLDIGSELRRFVERADALQHLDTGDRFALRDYIRYATMLRDVYDSAVGR